MTAQTKRQTAKKNQTDIERLAAEIADLDRLREEMEIAQKPARQEQEDLHPSEWPTWPNGSGLLANLQSTEKEATYRKDILYDHLTTLEPRSLTDALILVLCLSGRFDLYAPGEYPVKYMEEMDKAAIERLMNNLIVYLEREAGTTAKALGLTCWEYQHERWPETKKPHAIRPKS